MATTICEWLFHCQYGHTILIFFVKNHDQGRADNLDKRNRYVCGSFTRSFFMTTEDGFPLQFSPTCFWDSGIASEFGQSKVGHNIPRVSSPAL